MHGYVSLEVYLRLVRGKWADNWMDLIYAETWEWVQLGQISIRLVACLKRETCLKSLVTAHDIQVAVRFSILADTRSGPVSLVGSREDRR